MTGRTFQIFSYQFSNNQRDLLAGKLSPESVAWITWSPIRKPGSIQLQRDEELSAILLVDLTNNLDTGIQFAIKVQDVYPNLKILAICAQADDCRATVEKANILNCTILSNNNLDTAAQIIAMYVENKRLRQTAQESENRFLITFHDNPAPMIITQLEDGKIVDVNAAQCEMLGYSREELIGKSVLELGIWADPNDRKEMRKWLEKKGKVTNLEIRYRNKSGDIRYLLASIETIDFKDKPCMLSAALDITQRKQYENDLLESRSNLATSQSMARLGSWTYDIQSKKARWTEELFRIYDIDPQYEKIDLEVFYSRVHPEDRERVRVVNDRIKKDGKSFDIEFRLVTRSGEVRHIRELGNAQLDDQGNVVALFGTDQDITEHKILQWQLGERLKELTCLFNAGQLLANSGLSPDHVYQALVDSIPPAMQFPSLAAAYIEIDGKTYRTKNWDEKSPYQLKALVTGRQAEVGLIHVEYIEKAPFILPEEQNLLDNLAGMLGLWYERKLSHETLNRNEQQYRSALESMLEGIQILDFDMRYVYLNKVAVQQARKTAEELIGKSIVEMYPSVENTLLYQKIELCLKERVHSKIQNEFYYEDGKVAWFELSIEPTHAGVLIHSMDISERKQAESQLRSQYQEREHYLNLLEILTSFSTQFINLDLEKINDEFSAVLCDLGEFENADRAYIFRINDSYMSNTHEWCAKGIHPQIKNLQELPNDTFPWWMGKLYRDEIIHVSDVREMPDEASLERESLQAQGIQSLLVVPLRAKNRLLGFLGFDSVSVRRVWSSDTILLIQMAANILANAMLRCETEAQLQQRAEDLELIHKINQAKNRGDEMTDIIHMVSASLRRMFGCTAVLTCLSDEREQFLLMSNLDIGDHLEKAIEKVVGSRLDKLPIKIPLYGNGNFARIARSGKPEIITGDQGIRDTMREFIQNPTMQKFIPKVHKILSIQSVLLIPLTVQNHLIGFLDLNRTSEFTANDLERIQGIAHQFMAAMLSRNTEMELRLSEEKYRGLIESLDNVVATVDQEGRFLYMNDIAARNLGGTPKVFIGKSIRELFGEPFASKQLESTQKVFREDRSIVTESPVNINGKVEWYRTSLQPIHDAEGKVVNVLVNSLNINELKTAQQELLELNRTLEERVEERTKEVRDLYENAPAGYHSLDAQGNIIVVNQTELDWLGYQREEMIGRPVKDFLTPDSIRRFNKNFAIYKQRGWLRDLELDFIRRDGSILPALVSATAINDKEGNYLMSRTTLIDITETKKVQQALKESQANLQDFLDSANDLIQTVDEHCRFTYVNKAWCETLGYTSEEAMQMSMFDIVETEFHDHCRTILAGLDENKKPLRLEVIFQTKSGQSVFVEGSVVAHQDDNSLVRVNGIFRDITQRRQAEQELRNSRDELRVANISLEKAAQLKDEFLASMSHELRTPLTGVLGLSEALQLETYGPLNEKQKHALKDIESSGRHLLELINDILDLSKIEADKLDLQIEPCSVAEICQASLQLVKGMAQRKHQKVGFTSNLASAVIQADPRRVKQILVNLLSNAVKFTPEGGALGLDVKGHEEERIIQFTVWDEGIGIKEGDLKRLFTPFVQLDSSLSRQQSGTGLGLSLVSKLSELHGGSVSVESEVNKGSRFTVSLPWYPRDEQEKEEKGILPAAQVVSRCLLIEDNNLHARQISGYLAQMHIDCITYNSGVGAFETAIKVQPDVILLDLHLPDRDGVDVLKDLKKDPRTANIVVIISSIEDDHNYFLSHGAAGCLVKPFTLKDVEKEFIRLFDSSPQQRATDNSEPGQWTALVVDDNQIVLDTISDFLKSRDFTIVQAHNGWEMIDLALQIKPSVILADIQMPGMDGLEAIRRVRAISDPLVNQIPIIAITALAMTGDREKCLNAGANEYMSKPVHLSELEQVIRAFASKQPSIGEKKIDG